jgi:hypothetical protein
VVERDEQAVLGDGARDAERHPDVEVVQDEIGEDGVVTRAGDGDLGARVPPQVGHDLLAGPPRLPPGQLDVDAVEVSGRADDPHGELELSEAQVGEQVRGALVHRPLGTQRPRPPLLDGEVGQHVRHPQPLGHDHVVDPHPPTVEAGW